MSLASGWAERRNDSLQHVHSSPSSQITGVLTLLPPDQLLDELLATDADARRTIDLTPLWATAGRLHDAGLYHGTFLARNILVRGAADAPQFVLLDLPRCHVFPHGIRGSRMARYDLLFITNTLRRSLPADNLPQWLTAYGMSAQQQSRFADYLKRFRNSGYLRRAIGAEFNLRTWLGRLRNAARLTGR